MGALEYAPQRGPRRDLKLAISMKSVVEQSRHVLNHRIENMSGPTALKDLRVLKERRALEKQLAEAGLPFDRESAIRFRMNGVKTDPRLYGEAAKDYFGVNY